MSVRLKYQKAKTLGPRAAIRTSVDRALFTAGPVFERVGLQVQPRHYYSVVPSLRDLEANRDRWTRPSAMGGVALDADHQRGVLDDLATVSVDLMPVYDSVESGNVGEGMGAVDAELLYRTVRRSKPRRVIEIGSGTSTVYLAAALEANAAETGGDGAGELICIEPFRHQQLEDITASVPHRVIRELAQDVPLDEFRALGDGDVVFIDSTHVVRLDSDVVYLVLEVLPVLAPGVRVHVHDIGFPYPYVVPQHVFDDHMYWTEWALLQAFLQFNNAFCIDLSAAWMHHHHPEQLAANLTTYSIGQEFPPSSLWLRRTAP
jgi:hypothetical protein